MRSVRPWLWLPPAFAHKVSPKLLRGLNWLGHINPPEWNSFRWRGLNFPNRLGIAGGVDKDCENIPAWWALGAGFIEVGTITPLAQSGNTEPVLARDVAKSALWNRLGFPSRGVDFARHRLSQLKRPTLTPIFANIGKNANTPLDQAHLDYLRLYNELAGLVDGFVINISSPNTRGLRDLLKPDRLQDFLGKIMSSLPAARPPVLLKLSPDLEAGELERALTISDDLGIDGWVLTNTSQNLRAGLNFPKEGGVSGQPLAPLAREFLAQTIQLLGPRRTGKLLVSVGGVMSAGDVTERLALGADLVQVYSALIFNGPFFFRKVARAQRETSSKAEQCLAPTKRLV